MGGAKEVAISSGGGSLDIEFTGINGCEFSVSLSHRNITIFSDKLVIQDSHGGVLVTEDNPVRQEPYPDVSVCHFFSNPSSKMRVKEMVLGDGDDSSSSSSADAAMNAKLHATNKQLVAENSKLKAEVARLKEIADTTSGDTVTSTSDDSDDAF